MKIAVDSCSLILMAKASVLEHFAKSYELCLSEEVYKEVLAGKSKKIVDAFVVEKLAEEGRIKILKIKNRKMARKLSEDFSLGAGEAETLALVLDNRCVIVCTDNKQGRKAALIHNLSLVGSVDAVISLCKQKIISKEKATLALKKLRQFGWFSDYLIENAMEDVNYGKD